MAAYDAFLLGRYHLARRTGEALERVCRAWYADPGLTRHRARGRPKVAARQ